jgi:hypothetical protein
VQVLPANKSPQNLHHFLSSKYPMKRIFLTFTATALVAGAAFYLGRNRQLTPAPAAAAGLAKASSTHLKDVLAETDPIRHRTLFMQWLTSLTPDEAATSAQQLWALPGDVNEITERKKLFCYAWGQVDGAAAIEFARNQPGVGKVAALGAALAGWASKDPAAAKAWITSRMEPGEQLMYSWALVEGWARKDAAAATAYVLEMKEMPNAGRFIQTIALEQVRRDAVQAGAWALALPAGSLRISAVEEVATHWSRTAPQAATEWASTLPGNELAIPALKQTTTEWARQDPAAAGTWLHQLPPSTLRDQAVAGYCQVLAVQNLDSITQWTSTITDTSLREQSLLTIAQEWMGRNPQATRAWLPQSGLSAAATAKLRQDAP